MRKILFFVFSASALFSCNNKKEIKNLKCVVTYCEKMDNTPKSIHDEINMGVQKWKVKTSCGDNTFITKKPYQIGDTVTVTAIKYL